MFDAHHYNGVVLPKFNKSPLTLKNKFYRNIYLHTKTYNA